MSGDTFLDEYGVQSVDQILVALEQVLKSAVPQVLDLPGTKAYLGERAKDFADITTWQQVPTLEAIASADYPAVAITSPGLVEPPIYKRSTDLWETTWRASIGIYDRTGIDDGGQSATQQRVRDWIMILRTAALRNNTLAGIARGLWWAGEEYDLLPDRNKARTIGAGALALDVRVDVRNTLGMGLPAVSTTNTTLDVRTNQE